ncbi:MAG TPA: Gfo/Idh/MocA family oxidoreductase [Solirubrobacteraceae bacterium]|nr:Gfo/Idh/MocA family oxidoreductase [Solirubrobacteraceae bacterium]
MHEHNVAIIGYGLAGRVFHAPLIAATEGLRVGAIVTSDPARRRQAQAEYPEAVIHATAEELWAKSGDLAAVVIATPNSSHASLATQAIDHGLAVVVDKPLALSSREATQLIDHAEQKRTPLTVFQNRRWDSDQLTLANLLKEGALGTVQRYESRFERWRREPRPEAWRERTTPAQGGGLLLDLGSHLVDQALHHFGPAQTVYAEVDSRRGTPADDDVFLALTHVSGVISHLHASALVAAPGPRLRVLGSEGALIVRELDSQEDRLRAGQRPDTAADWGEEPEHARPRLIAGERSIPLRPERGAWQTFYARFRDVLAGQVLVAQASLPVDPRDAVATLRVIEAARSSASERRVVSLD